MNLAGIANLLEELRRRNVFRVGAAYGIVAWLLIQIVVSVEAPLHLPDWVDTFTIILLIIGFPVALLFAWAFELTPDGVKRTPEVNPAESTTSLTGRKFDFIIIGLLLMAVIFLVLDNYVWTEKVEEPAVSATEKQVSDGSDVAEPDDKSIAVLPFTNRSTTEDDAYFSDGLHDDLLTHLSKISDMKVISRTSVMQYRDTTKSMKDIGDELGVATIMEGGVQRAGNQVRINVQLIDADTDEHLWAEIYDRELTAANIFAIQSEIATAIAGALRATLSEEEQQRLATIPTENLVAYESYMQGHQLMRTRSPTSLAEAVEHFKKAVALDENYALAYVGLADAYQLQAQYSGMPEKGLWAKAQEAVEIALKLDPDSGEAYTSLGGIKSLQGDFVGAETAFKYAIELNPNYVTSHQWYSHMLTRLGRHDEALLEVKKALELDPLFPLLIQNLGHIYISLGRSEEAVAAFKHAIKVAPNFKQGYAGMGDYYTSYEGRFDKSVEYYRKALAVSPGDVSIYKGLGHYYASLGDSEESWCWSSKALAVGPDSAYSNYVVALMHLYDNNYDKAMEYARRSYEGNSELPSSFPGAVLRDHEIRQGDYDAALAIYEDEYDALLSYDSPVVNVQNYNAAIGIAYVLTLKQERERAELLLDAIGVFINSTHRRGWNGFGLGDVMVYVMRGEKEKALAALREAIDSGWRDQAGYSLLGDKVLDPLREEPAFREMQAEVEADMAAQLQRVRAMDLAGEDCS